MLRTGVDAVLRHLRQTVKPAAGALTDGELLRRWACHGDEAALEVLLWRHGPMVLGVCRRVLRHEQDAEDAFQATFLTLVRRASAIRDGQALAAWLHCVAVRAALAARTSERQCPITVAQLPDIPAATSDALATHDIGPVLDEEIARLPEKYRRPFVLCYLEGRTNDEAARELNCPRGTVCTRLAWARERLRDRLARRGVTLSVAVLTAALASEAALPSGLASGTVEASVAFAAGVNCPSALRAARIARRVMTATLPGTWRTVGWLTLAAGAIVLGVGVATLHAQPAKESPAEPAPQAPAKAPRHEARDLRSVRAALARRNGASDASEAAVAAGLKWLAAQQTPDGHWEMGATKGGAAPKNDVAATALALLSFLGAGVTHQDRDDPFAANVERGLGYLVKVQDKDGRLGTDTMYTHGIATMALGNAYALTADPKLEAPARRAVEFIVTAQSGRGGWRYHPRGQDSDTSVTGWQVQALALGQLAGFEVPKRTADGVMKYLDSVQSPKGGYGYVMPQATPSMTAAGLLCRLQLGWDERNPAVQTALSVLRASPPGSRKSLYHDYYATQAMFFVGGKDWEDWNPKMRDLLVERQEKGLKADKADLKGSWSPAEDTFAVNSPLLATSLALMILEVYYRHDLPLERQGSEKLTAKELGALWSRLGEAGSFEGRRQVARLARQPRDVVPFLAEQVRPASPLNATERQEIDRLIRNLDDDDFAKREAAAKALDTLGGKAEAALRRTLAAKPSLDVVRRVERLLDKYTQTVAAERTRTRRALEVLEHADTPEAWAVVERLAKGPANDWLTDEARAALARRNPSPPRP
jgi:RNA polymerase sigma factor (sigma-70 family)